MPARSNALSELTRFWLEIRHGCFFREAIPVPVPYGLSDIDLAAIRPDGTAFTLPSGIQVGPRIIIETKDEHDWDASGKKFGNSLLSDIENLKDGPYIPADVKGIHFVMLRQQHYEVAHSLFRSDDFDRLFVVHAIDAESLKKCEQHLQRHHIHWLTLTSLIDDLQKWYKQHPRRTSLRNSITGDMFHLIFGFYLGK